MPNDINDLEAGGVFDDMIVKPKKLKKKVNYDKNIILYGPPGTGKTYNSAIYAVAICDNKSLDELTDYSAVMKRYNELKKQGRIAFTTFHQSYGYEEFIEGIKPMVGEDTDKIGYEIEDGVFKAFCKRAELPENIDINPNAKIWKVILREGRAGGKYISENLVKAECFNKGQIIFDWKTRSEEQPSSSAFASIVKLEDKMNVGDIVVSYEGKSSTIDAIGIITGEAIYDEEKPNCRWSCGVKWLQKNITHDIQELNGNKYFSNDAIQHLRRVSVADLLNLIEPKQPSAKQNYVFIIDEINRGNISKIFGELITLIENTKRGGMPEAASATLPYSGDDFSVPSNVYILGTMNTADRSIALMDTALRRRFQFIEMMPDSSVLDGIMIDDLNVAEMLDTINRRIEVLYDREHTIGHAFFTSLKDENATIEKLQSIFKKSIIPLLQEYFYEDYEKIQLVLGDNAKSSLDYKFISDEKIKTNIFKGKGLDLDLPENKYSINRKAFQHIESYIEIYKVISDESV